MRCSLPTVCMTAWLTTAPNNHRFGFFTRFVPLWVSRWEQPGRFEGRSHLAGMMGLASLGCVIPPYIICVLSRLSHNSALLLLLLHRLSHAHVRVILHQQRNKLHLYTQQYSLADLFTDIQSTYPCHTSFVHIGITSSGRADATVKSPQSRVSLKIDSHL